MRKLREIKKNKKGFTLVEVIIVLVILGILAAILVPSFVGYVDKAKEHQVISETRQIVQAVQVLASEKYIKDGDGGDYEIGTDISFDDIEALCELSVSSANLEGETVGGKVYILTYTNGSTCTYQGGTYTVS